MTRHFTGWHMTGILVGFFGIVIAVNFTMAVYANTTFGGIVVENSYVASQEFNRWLGEARSEDGLGWDARTTWRPDGRLAVSVNHAPDGIRLQAFARHPLGRLPDRALTFEPLGSGQFLSREALPRERWSLRLTLSANGRVWRREEALQ
jgi:nitrogen fixation protein FixH